MSDDERTSKDPQRVYIPKSARVAFQEITDAFMQRGAAAFPDRFKRYIAPAFAHAGTSLEAGVLAVMILSMRSEIVLESAPRTGDEEREDSEK